METWVVLFAGQDDYLIVKYVLGQPQMAKCIIIDK